MAKLNQIRKSGGSMIIAIPKSMGMAVGDWMQFQKKNDVSTLMIRMCGAEPGERETMSERDRALECTGRAEIESMKTNHVVIARDELFRLIADEPARTIETIYAAIENMYEVRIYGSSDAGLLMEGGEEDELITVNLRPNSSDPYRITAAEKSGADKATRRKRWKSSSDVLAAENTIKYEIVPTIYYDRDGGELPNYMLELLDRITGEHARLIETSCVSGKQKTILRRGEGTYFVEDMPEIDEMSDAIKLKYATLCIEIGEKYGVEMKDCGWYVKRTIDGESTLYRRSYPDLVFFCDELR